MVKYSPFQNKATIYEVYNGTRKLSQHGDLRAAKMAAARNAKRLGSRKSFIGIKRVSLVGFYSK